MNKITILTKKENIIKILCDPGMEAEEIVIAWSRYLEIEPGDIIFRLEIEEGQDLEQNQDLEEFGLNSFLG